MQELRIGDPADLRTDVGPVIDEAHARCCRRTPAGSTASPRRSTPAARRGSDRHGTFFAPRAYEIDSLVAPRARSLRADPARRPLARRGSRPGLRRHRQHRLRPDAGHPQPHRRNHQAHHHRLHVGNTYVNRNIIGAVVGVQPFGGEGLSGTGPKAGGPHYLYRFASERTLSVDTTAAGGNAGLMALDAGRTCGRARNKEEDHGSCTTTTDQRPDPRCRLWPDRHRLHDGLRHHRHDQLRARRHLHGQRLHRGHRVHPARHLRHQLDPAGAAAGAAGRRPVHLGLWLDGRTHRLPAAARSTPPGAADLGDRHVDLPAEHGATDAGRARQADRAGARRRHRPADHRRLHGPPRPTRRSSSSSSPSR
jgi:hypothetical protein